MKDASIEEPVRFLDGAGDAAEIALLRAAQATPPPGARERMTALVQRGARANATSVARSRWPWLAWGALGLGLLTTSALLVRETHHDAPPMNASEGAPAQAAESAALSRPSEPAALEAAPASTPGVPVTALPSVAPSATTRPPSAARSSNAEPPAADVDDNQLAKEVAALDRARRALREGHVTSAQDVLDAYDRTFARPILAPEATLIRVEALLRAGEEAKAQTLGERFIAQSPNGAYVGRMKSLLQSAAGDR